MKKITIFLLFISIFPAVSFAQNITGTWFFNGTGYTGELKIIQTGNTFTGTVYGDTILHGLVTGRKITFTRTNSYLTSQPGVVHPQEFTGYLFTKGPMAMAGTFRHRNSNQYGWYATKR